MNEDLDWLLQTFREYADIFAQEYSGAGTTWDEVEAVKERAANIIAALKERDL